MSRHDAASCSAFFSSSIVSLPLSLILCLASLDSYPTLRSRHGVDARAWGNFGTRTMQRLRNFPIRARL